jgi:hypothetical protein
MTRCLLAFFLLVGVSAAQVVLAPPIQPVQGCTTPPSGMTAWYTGDGTANDFFGNNNGTLQNGTGFVSGKVAQAFSLNGINEFVSLPPNVIPYPAAGATSTQPMSVDAWFSTRTGGVILGQQDAAAPAMPNGHIPAIYVGTDGFLYAELFWNGTPVPIRSPHAVNDGNFHFVAVTYDGSNEVVYLDGASIGATPFIQVGYVASYQYQIGTGYTAGWPATNGGYFYFQGLIDEVEIFNRALSQSEILEILRAGSAGKCKVTPVTPAACIAPPSGMTSWYTGDGTANDFLGNNNGTLQNGAGFAGGEVSQAFSLDSTKQQFVSLPGGVIPYPVAGATSTQPMSVDAWFSTTSGGVILGQQGLAVPPAPPSGHVPAIYVGTDGFLYAEMFWKGSPTPISSAPVKVNNGAFHFVAVTYDGVNEAVYLDNTLLGSTPVIQMGYAASYRYQIGTGFTPGWPAGNGGYFYFQGLIDEVEIFNRALAPSEIQAIFSAGSAGKCKNQAPVARCKNVTVSACMADASIDDGSYDPDGDRVTLKQTPPGPYPVGTTNVTLKVTDNHGDSSQCSATVTVTPTGTGPVAVLSLTAKPNVLWPPNHKMVLVTVTPNTSGNCSAVTCKIVKVTSNEPIAPWDYKITGNLTVELRASRLGRGNGRVYTITVQCTDAARNVTTKTVTVTVPHDMGNGGDDNDQGGDNGGGDQDQGNGHGDGHGHGRGR